MSREGQLATEGDQRPLSHAVAADQRLGEQYAHLEQQNETAAFGMWLFLLTELMFFGTLFTALNVYRFLHTEAFELASTRLNWQIGGLNTAVLLLSSLLMALAVFYVRTGNVRPLVVCLLATAALGAVFLVLKGYEYFDDYQKGLILGSRFNTDDWTGAGLPSEKVSGVKLFLLLYWVMTGAHALHMIVGIGAVLVIAGLAWHKRFDADYFGPVDVTGLYWHYVDLVWIFLFPMLYLLGTHAR